MSNVVLADMENEVGALIVWCVTILVRCTTPTGKHVSALTIIVILKSRYFSQQIIPATENHGVRLYDYEYRY